MKRLHDEISHSFNSSPMSQQGKIWSCLDTKLDINATEKILVTKIIILMSMILR